MSDKSKKVSKAVNSVKKNEGKKSLLSVIKAKGNKSNFDKKTADTRHHLARGVLQVTVAVVLVITLVCVTFVGAAYAYQSNYSEKALFGTKILGEDMGGLNKKEIQQKVTQSLSRIRFKFSVDGKEFTATPKEVGISYNNIKTTDNAFMAGRHGDMIHNLAYSVISLTYKINPATGLWLAEGTTYKIHQNVSVDYKIDDAKMDKFTKKISKAFNTRSKDAGLVIKGTDVKVIPAVYGRAVATESIKSQIKQALLTGDSTSINIRVAEVKPEIIETEASESIADAQEILEQTAVYSFNGQKYVPAKETIGNWIVFKKIKGKLVPVVDSAKVKSYLNTIADDINVPAVNQRVKVINGGKREITRAGKNGLAVDVNTPAAKTATALNARKGVNLALTTYVVKFKTEFNNVLVAKWDKYIEIDIGTQRMCAYLSGGEKVNCWAVTTGQNNVIEGLNTNTPTGTFLIRRKAGAGGIAGGPGGGGVCMPNPPYDTPLCGINYVSTFTAQGHAIHEAWWRTSFGTQAYRWNGSHGCINAPYSVAKFIYYWAPIGTPVVIHY